MVLLLYYKPLFPLLFHNPEGRWVGRSGVPHIPEDTDRALLGTGLHLDTQVTPLLPHQSSGDTAAPRRTH